MVRAPDRKLISFLASYDPQISSLTLAAREVVLEEAPEAKESINSGYAVSIGFSFTGKPIKDGFCIVVAGKSHVNLMFNRGTSLPDPNRVLEGTGKAMRHIKLRSEKDLQRAFIRRYIQAAIELVR